MCAVWKALSVCLTLIVINSLIQGRGGCYGGGGGGGGAGSPHLDRCNLIVNYLPNELTDDGLRVRAC